MALLMGLNLIIILLQTLAGPSFIAVFTICSLLVGFASDNIRRLGRHRIMAAGVLLFSISCLLMGMSNAFWQLVLLRMGIAAGISSIISIKLIY